MSKPQSVTSLEVSPEIERRNRFIKYTLAMVIRVVCIILAVTIPAGWITIVFVAGAVFLPYFAVVIANAQGVGSSKSSAKSAEAPTISISPDSFREAKRDEEDKK